MSVALAPSTSTDARPSESADPFTSADHDPWDVVVVGAGPAGARAAHAARAAGATVLLIEREQLPRYKLCGGGLLQPSLDSLPPGVEVPTRAEVHRVSFSHRGRRQRLRHDRRREPIMRMVYRLELDHRLVEAARAGGVVLLEGCTVRGLVDEGDLVVLDTSAGPLRARAVVGADGSAGRCGRHVGARFAQVDLGLEIEFALDAGLQATWRDRVHLDWGAIPGSYGWAFPKGDQLTVGVILDRSRGAEGRAYLEQLVRVLGLGDARRLSNGGHLTRCREARSPLSRGRVVLAGDAAGLLEPWTREGISYALRSGALAGLASAALARCASEADAGEVRAGYDRDIDSTLGAEMRAGAQCLAAFERRPALFHLALAFSTPGWAAFRRLSRGRTTFARLLGHRAVRAALALTVR